MTRIYQWLRSMCSPFHDFLFFLRAVSVLICRTENAIFSIIPEYHLKRIATKIFLVVQQSTSNCIIPRKLIITHHYHIRRFYIMSVSQKRYKFRPTDFHFTNFFFFNFMEKFDRFTFFIHQPFSIFFQFTELNWPV